MFLVLLHLAGGVALLTWGLHMVESGIMRACGAGLRQVMAGSLSNRFKAFLAGLGVTAVLQSSTATGLIASAFAARKLMTPVTGLAIMLGANVGSTLIVQAFSLDLSWLSPACLVAGMALFERGKGSQHGNIGRALIGLGLMLLALALLVGTMRQAETAPAVRSILGVLTGQPLLTAGLAALLTWCAHSSTPVVLFVMSLAGAHAMPLDSALAMVLGANIGSALNPYVEGAKGNDNVRKRLPTGNLLLRGGVCLALLPLVSLLADLLSGWSSDASHLIAHVHTLLNLAIAVVFIGLLGPLAELLERLFPDNRQAESPDAPRYLDPSAIGSPSVALACATREALHMGDVVEDMLRRSIPALLGDDRRMVSEVVRRDDAVDRLHEAIKLYVTAVTREGLEPADGRRAMAIMSFVINMEHIGDIVDKNLMELAAKKIKGKLRFSEEGAAELLALHEQVLDSFHRAQAAFVSSCVKTAERILDDKVTVRDLEREGADKHLLRLRDGRPESILSSSLHLDVLRDLKRIHSHICATAYPILEQQVAAE
ncbi:Na/Pi cotransporter family protein [Pseudogulbenkiania sp. MAI-1]|uniref:Na/Pi cotransporter family protein n=1 Tax=Pseudogulbenkiania sp. MAI-1 TaxID=990370 RepID=UPI00045EB368|nr:Na/Pi cotransporter family protein [Pseudogulbenkiania sp. MAI-1]